MRLRCIEYEIPLLQTLIRLGGSVKVPDIYPVVKEIMKPKFDEHPEEYERRKGEPIWKNQTRFARNRLKNKGQLDASRPGIWEITQSGRDRVRMFKETDRDPDQYLGKSDFVKSETKRTRRDLRGSFHKPEASQQHHAQDIHGPKVGSIAGLHNSSGGEIPVMSKVL